MLRGWRAREESAVDCAQEETREAGGTIQNLPACGRRTAEQCPCGSISPESSCQPGPQRTHLCVCRDLVVPPGRQAGRQSPRREAVALTHGYLPGNTALRMTCSTSCVYHRLFHQPNNPLQIKNGLCNRPFPEIAQVPCVLDGPPYPFTTVLLL